MAEIQICPSCASEYTYEDHRGFIICSLCAHEWDSTATVETDEDKEQIKDANENILQDGDSVIVIKDLPVKGSSQPVKQGTKVKNIRLIYGAADGHDIDCRIDGFGAMKLKSEFVRKG